MPPSFIISFCSTGSDQFLVSHLVKLAYSIETMLYANLKGRQTMMTTREVMEQLAGKGIVQELVSYAEQIFDDFKEVHSKYLRTIEQFRREIGKDVSPTVDELVDAIDRQTASNLFFSGVLGIQSNYEHFINPMARTVLDVDCDVYLRENTARRLPEYEKAEEIIDAFFANLTSAQKEQFSDVMSYISYLETIGPKLAHYYGYVLGNKVLYMLVPGYCPDDVLTIRYTNMLNRYMGTGKKLQVEQS